MKIIGADYECGQKIKGVGEAFNKLRSYLLTRTSNLHLLEKDPDQTSGSFLLSLHNLIKDNLNDFVLNIGGDHTIGCATASATKRIYPKTSLIWIDAHGDFNNFKSSLTKSMHGMPLNALRFGSATFAEEKDFDWLGYGLYSSPEICIIGLRDVDPEELEMLKTFGIAYFGMFEIKSLGIEKIAQMALEAVDPWNTGTYHISCDVDSMSWDEFPATGCITPGGLTVSEFKQLISLFQKTGKVKAIDLVEYNPMLDKENTCYEKMCNIIATITQ